MGNQSSKRTGEQLNTTPTGLYEHCEWDPKVVRRLILERKLAPISFGKDEAIEEGLEECPICFLYYAGGLNRSKCCRKGACTECYLQVKRPNQTTTGPLSKEEIAQEEQEQLKVLELKINMRKEEIERDKQREQEKERLRKERELSGEPNPPPPPPARSAPTNIRQSPAPDSQPNSVSSSSSPFGTYQNQTFIPQPAFGENLSAEPDLDELMLMEAIRLSLLDVRTSLQDDSPKPLDTPQTSTSNRNSADIDIPFPSTTSPCDNTSNDTPTTTTTTTTSTNTTSSSSTGPADIHNDYQNNLPSYDNSNTSDITGGTTTTTTTTSTTNANDNTEDQPNFDIFLHSTDTSNNAGDIHLENSGDSRSTPTNETVNSFFVDES